MNKRRKRGQRIRIIAIWSAVAIVIVAVLAVALPLLATGASRGVTIRIPKNATEQELRDSLTQHLGEDYAGRVVSIVKAGGADLAKRHGAYRIEEGMSPAKAARVLTRGMQQPVRITINGFRTLDNLAERVAAKFDFTAEDLLNYLRDPATAEHYGLTPDQIMAVFVDDTYEAYWTATPQSLVGKIGDNYGKLWNADRREKASRLGITPAQAMIIASIVDEETNKADEKGMVARVYINRLRKGMRLQADPTVKYAVGDFSIKRITKKHLATESPYNTYRVNGLPPGPIRTTSRQTIDALLDSPETDVIYMCAREDFSGYHNFTASYEEHLRNARRYQDALDKLQIH